MALVEAMRVSALTLALFVAAGEALGAATIESIGAEKCAGRVNAFEVESLLPKVRPWKPTRRRWCEGRRAWLRMPLR
jgi:hypothetical protein